MIAPPGTPVRPVRIDAVAAVLLTVAAVAAAVLAASLVDAFVTGGATLGAPSTETIPRRMPTAEFLAHALAAQAGLLVTTAVLLAFARSGAPDATVPTPRREIFKITMAGALAVLCLNALGSWGMEALGEPYGGLPELGGLGWNAAILLVAGCAAPVVEELFFREVILSRTLAAVPRAGALAITSLAFGAMHLPAGGPVLFVTLSALGVVFGWLRLRTGSLGPAIAAHAVNNLFALGLAWLSG